MVSIFRIIVFVAIAASYISFSSCQTKQQVLVRPNINTLNDSLVEIKPFSDAAIEKLLKKHSINGASIAYINYDKKGWTKGYGFADSKKTIAIAPNTQFQAASISKAVSAYVMMSLINSNRYSLDDDLRAAIEGFGIVNHYPNTILSLRNLLKHKAGINYYQLKGYPRNTTLPTIEHIIAGQPPAHNEAIQVLEEPYKTSNYSEGGYVLVEKLINEKLKGRGNPTPFSEAVSYSVIDKLNMTHTSVGEPIDTNAIAFGHSTNGKMVSGKYLIYPENAAAGIWTTPQDLALLAYEMAGYKNNTNKILSEELAEEFITDGLGISYDSQKNLFGSFGRNEGYSCHFSFSLNKMYGIVIMTNSENGGPFIEDVYKIIDRQYAKIKEGDSAE